MAFSRRLLNDDEHVVVSTRTHVKALLLPAIWLILVAGVAGFVASWAGSHAHAGRAKPLVEGVVWLIALGVVLRIVVTPFLRWLTATYTVTNRRLITRSGILSRRGHDIPLARISDVAYEHGLVDRLFGCGTLVISDASERGSVELPDIPRVEQVHLQISDLLSRRQAWGRLGEEAGRLDDGT